jgi:cytochrome c oxidase cbb3-type subunit 3
MSKKETNRLLGHADEADGIEEYDNPLPDWWLGMLWLTIAWAIGYGIHYHFIGHRSQPKALAAEIAEAQVLWPAAKGGAQVVMTPEAIEKGRAIFMANCTGCHGKNLEGGIGPNLKDATWIHGGSPAEVVKTITEGVPAKGMLTWGPILGPEKINLVAAFVLSQGEKVSTTEK